MYLKSFSIQAHCFFSETLFSLDVSQIVEGVGMSGTQSEGGVVTFFSLLHLTFFFQGIGQIAVGIWEVGLKLYGPTISVNGQVNQSAMKTVRQFSITKLIL